MQGFKDAIVVNGVGCLFQLNFKSDTIRRKF